MGQSAEISALNHGFPKEMINYIKSIEFFVKSLQPPNKRRRSSNINNKCKYIVVFNHLYSLFTLFVIHQMCACMLSLEHIFRPIINYQIYK